MIMLSIRRANVNDTSEIETMVADFAKGHRSEVADWHKVQGSALIILGARGASSMRSLRETKKHHSAWILSSSLWISARLAF